MPKLDSKAMRKIHHEDIPAVVDWLKSVLAISSSGIGAIAFSAKPDAAIPGDFKFAVFCFAMSVVLTLGVMLSVYGHKRAETESIPWLVLVVIILIFLLFLSGLGAVVLYIFR